MPDTQHWEVHTLIAVLREVAPDKKLQVRQKAISGFNEIYKQNSGQ